MWHENKTMLLSFKLVYSYCHYNISLQNYMQNHLVIQTFTHTWMATALTAPSPATETQAADDKPLKVNADFAGCQCNGICCNFVIL